MSDIKIRAATLTAVNEALSDAHSLLALYSQHERSEKRYGPAWKACAAIEKAQMALVKDTRP